MVDMKNIKKILQRIATGADRFKLLSAWLVELIAILSAGLIVVFGSIEIIQLNYADGVLSYLGAIMLIALTKLLNILLE